MRRRCPRRSPRRRLSQLHLQTFPAAGFSHVLTLTVSSEPTGNGLSFVGQIVNGAG